jgi:hypothetical protein
MEDVTALRPLAIKNAITTFRFATLKIQISGTTQRLNHLVYKSSSLLLIALPRLAGIRGRLLGGYARAQQEQHGKSQRVFD